MARASPWIDFNAIGMSSGVFMRGPEARPDRTWRRGKDAKWLPVRRLSPIQPGFRETP